MNFFDILLAKKLGGGGGVTIEELNVTENGTYSEELKAYSPVIVNVKDKSEQTLAAYIDGTVKEITSEYVTYTRQLAFRFCNQLEKIDFPNCTLILQNTFNGCESLKNVNLPKVTTLFSDAFQNCTNLEILNLPELDTLSNGTFNGCTKLSTLIFKKNQVVYIGELSNLFLNTPFYTNKTGGTLYVPQALITAYENDANWSIVLNYNSNNKILPIEGSIYE